MLTSKQESMARDTVSIVLAVWGGVYLLSGVARMNIKATVKTIVGSYLLYKGINDYRELHDSGSNSLLSENETFVFDEANTFSAAQDPTLE